jgi:hypothetical protein
VTDRTKNILKNLLALVIGLGLLCTLLCGAELFLRFRAHEDPKDNHKDFFSYVPELGWQIKENYSGHHRLRVGTEEIFSVHYEFDAHHRRITPVTDADMRQKAALFFGCSFVFGFGVEQEDTLPAFFSRDCTSLLPINFGSPGYGPQHMWLQIQHPDFLASVPREKGIILYGFIDDHLSRLMGEPNMIANWGPRLPWLDISEEGVIYKGLMKDRESVFTALRQKLMRLHTGRFILNRLSLLPVAPYTEEEALQMLVWLLSDVKRKVNELLPGYDLVVFAYPGALRAAGLGDALEKTGIPFFNYSRLYDGQEAALGHYYYADAPPNPWGHPKPATYEKVAALLAKDLAEYCGSDENTIGDTL